ncbi:molecular chaperone GroEL, partial [Candidatus Poribacteria bacterium]|nr:molecular chaperone GroEL [Candidatus Poribacteria bacterium]
SVIVARVKEEGGNIGYDALRDEFGDMFQAGVIDPTKVVRVALQNASSIAGLMITTEALVADIPEEAPPMPAGPPPGGGGGGMGGMGGMY